MGYYHTAQICLNGHVITDSYDKNPEFRQNYCDKCGQPTITKCPNCNSNIRGDYECNNVVSIGFSTPAPNFCHNCGKPFPWTKDSLDSIQELLSLESTLESSELEYLNSNLPSILTDTPKTKLVATKLKLALGKLGSTASSAIHDIIVDVASETAKKIIFPE